MTLEIKLSRLRQIGWDEWDPIGIRCFDDQSWRDVAADEYDTYLLHVVSLLRAGASKVHAVEYLDMIASEHMGLGIRTEEGHQASLRTVEAIQSYISGLPEGPLRVRRG